MYEMMNEMQTLAFQELEPDAYASITRRLKQLTRAGRRPRQPDRPRPAALPRRQRPRSRGHGPPEASLLDLEEDGRAAHQLRAIVRRDGLPRHRRRRRRLLPRARPDPPAAGRWSRAASRITSRPPSATAIARCTPRSSTIRRCGSKSRSATARCTSRPSAGSPPTGPIRKASRAPTSTCRGSTIWSKSSTMPKAPRSCSSIPGWRCTRTGSSPSPRRAS